METSPEKTVYFVFGTDGVRGYYKWSFEQGYAIMYNGDMPKDAVGEIIDIGRPYNKCMLFFPDATLARLSKATGYDYLYHGYYKFQEVVVDDSSVLLVPRHWLNNFGYSYASRIPLEFENGVLFQEDESYCGTPFITEYARGKTLADVFNIVDLDLLYIFGMIFRKGIPQDHTDIDIIITE